MKQDKSKVKLTNSLVVNPVNKANSRAIAVIALVVLALVVLGLFSHKAYVHKMNKSVNINTAGNNSSANSGGSGILDIVKNSNNKFIKMVEQTSRVVYKDYGKDCYLVRFYGHVYANGEFVPNKKWYLYFACPKTDKTVLFKYTNEPIFWQTDSFSNRPKLDTSNLLSPSKIGEIILANCNVTKTQDLQMSLNFNKGKQAIYWRVSCKPKNFSDIFLKINAKTGEIIN